jgi:hypothetical protein
MHAIRNFGADPLGAAAGAVVGGVTGSVLEETGVAPYAIPRRFGVRPAYRITLLNEVVLVEPATRKVVEVID